METPRLFYKLAEFAEIVGKTEYELIQMAAAGEMALSVWFDGLLFCVDEGGFRLINAWGGLLVLPSYSALEFLFDDTVTVQRLTGRVPCEDVGEDGLPTGNEHVSVETETQCAPGLKCRAVCNRVDWFGQKDQRQVYVQIGREQEFLSSPYPPDIWQLEPKCYPTYSVKDLLVSTREAVRLRRYFTVTKVSLEKSKDINPKKEKTLLKIIGALVRIHYDKEAYKINGRFNALAIESSIKQRLSTDEGLKDKTIRTQIPEAIKALEEN